MIFGNNNENLRGARFEMTAQNILNNPYASLFTNNYAVRSSNIDSDGVKSLGNRNPNTNRKNEYDDILKKRGFSGKDDYVPEQYNKEKYNIFEREFEQKYIRNSSGYGNRSEKSKNMKENSLNSIKNEDLIDIMKVDFFTPPPNNNNKQNNQNPYSFINQPNASIFEKERNNLRGYAGITGIKEEMDVVHRGRNMSEDFFSRKDSMGLAQGGPQQKNFARNIKQTLNFNSDNPQKLMEREIQKLKWQEELANQMELKKNMKLEELKKRKQEAELEEQRIIREREEINKNYLQQIEREERHIKTKGQAMQSNNAHKEKNEYKPISEAEEIFMKKKFIPIRRTPPAEVKRPDPNLERRDQHSKSVVENSLESDRLLEARKHAKEQQRADRKPEYKEDSYQQINPGQNSNKTGQKSEEVSGHRNQLFDIHEKLLKQLEEMKNDIKQIDFQRDQAQNELKSLRTVLKKRAEEAERLKPEPLIMGSQLYNIIKDDIELSADPKLDSGDALENILKNKTGNVEFNGESKFISLSDDWKKGVEDDIERQKIKELILEEARKNKEDITTIDIEARIIEYKERLIQEAIAAAKERERLIQEEENRKKQLLIEEENKKKQLELEEENKKKAAIDEEIRRRQMIEEENKATREGLNQKLIEAEAQHESLKAQEKPDEKVKDTNDKGVDDKLNNNEEKAEEDDSSHNTDQLKLENNKETKDSSETVEKKKRELSQPLFDENGEIKLRYAFTPPNKKKIDKNIAHGPDKKTGGDIEGNPEAGTKTQFGRLDRLVQDFKK